jgi:transcriptional regulator with XRE-family HTH domain
MKLEKLHETMDRLGVKPEALAQKTGLSFSTIQKARRGHSVTLGTATLIALGMKMKKEDLVAASPAPVDAKAVAARIRAFLAKYGKRAADDETLWSSPDASELEGVAQLLEADLMPSRYPWSEWGSGGYGPYSSKEGKAEHDEILRLVGEVLKGVKA